jgi:hypothetical protein
MSTYQEIQDRINNHYLNRGTFITETQTAIKAAIRHYEYKRVSFNETATALTTVAGQSFLSFPSNYLFLDQLQITVNGEDLDLNRRDKAWILSRNATRSQSQPTDYATFQGRINLSAIPNAAYSCPLHYIKQLPALSAQTSTNPWITGVWEDVIVYHAAKLVWAVSIRNDKEAAKFAGLETQALQSALGLHDEQTVGRITPTSF